MDTVVQSTKINQSSPTIQSSSNSRANQATTEDDSTRLLMVKTDIDPSDHFIIDSEASKSFVNNLSNITNVDTMSKANIIMADNHKIVS
jgi:hypothetical protein